nr:defensin [Gerbera hybrid cultivar]WGC54891.1 plant defensin protein PDF2.2 [Gerbera hybrid cultivar]
MAKTSFNGSVFLLLLLLLLVPYECQRGGKMMMVAEARTCLSQSHGFKGKCLSHHNCGLVCKNEGFPGGRCRGFRRRCFCTKNC